MARPDKPFAIGIATRLSESWYQVLNSLKLSPSLTKTDTLKEIKKEFICLT